MANPIIAVHDAITGETYEREMTDEEVANLPEYREEPPR